MWLRLSGNGVDSDMCARPGKILSSPKMIRIIHSASTLSVESRRRYRYRLKIAMRNSVADMVEILEGGDPKSAAFLRSELERLPGFINEKNAATRPNEPEDGGPAAMIPIQDVAKSRRPEEPKDEDVDDPNETDTGMGLDGGLW